MGISFDKVKCPNCGASYAEYHYSTSTCMGWATIIKDGEVISHDPNWHTSYYTCLKCRHKFHIRERYGEPDEIIDDGEEKVVPVISTCLNDFTVSVTEI